MSIVFVLKISQIRITIISFLPQRTQKTNESRVLSQESINLKYRTYDSRLQTVKLRALRFVCIFNLVLYGYNNEKRGKREDVIIKTTTREEVDSPFFDSIFQNKSKEKGKGVSLNNDCA